MVRVAIVASSLALAVAALPAVADDSCVQTACSGACAQAGDDATVSTTAAGCPASCQSQTVAVAAEGACQCNAAGCQQTTKVVEKAAECLETGKSTSKAIRLTLERLPIVGLSLGFSRNHVVDASSGTCADGGVCQTVVATEASGECGAACTATKAVVANAESGCSCNCTCRDADGGQQQDVVTGIPVPGVSRVFTVKTAHEPHDVMVRTAALDVAPGHAVGHPGIHRFQLHVVDQSVYMFDPVTGSLFEPGDQGNWTVRAALTGTH